jgi:hypothetical protein
MAAMMVMTLAAALNATTDAAMALPARTLPRDGLASGSAGCFAKRHERAAVATVSYWRPGAHTAATAVRCGFPLVKRGGGQAGPRLDQLHSLVEATISSAGAPKCVPFSWRSPGAQPAAP